jgi:hypothetical protein
LPTLNALQEKKGGTHAAGARLRIACMPDRQQVDCLARDLVAHLIAADPYASHLSRFELLQAFTDARVIEQPVWRRVKACTAFAAAVALTGARSS